MARHKTVTLNLPDSLLRRFRDYAAERNRSMSHLLAEAIEAFMNREKDFDVAKHRFLERIRNAPDRGTNGKISWSREDLH